MFANHRTHQRVNVGEAYALVESRSGDFIGEGDAGLARSGEGAPPPPPPRPSPLPRS